MIKSLKGILAYRKAIDFYNKQMYQEASQIFWEILKRNPKSKSIHVSMSRFYYAQTQYHKGVVHFALEIALKP